MKFKIEGTKFSRDVDTMAILCNDRGEVTRYENELRKHQENLARDIEINKIKSDISEIKLMLQSLIDRG
jgi:hypothetical protein